MDITHTYKNQEYTNQEFLELDNEKRELEAKNETLASSNRTFKIATIVFALLFVLSTAYIVISEVREPLVGKWPKIARDNKELRSQVEELELLKPKIDSLVAVNNTLVEQTDMQDGIFFEVQIGAFEHFSLDQYMQELTRLKKEVDGLDKYTLGKFRDFKNALAFNNDIKKMGVNDAFIVAKVNGQRTELQEAVKASKKKLYTKW